MSSALRISGLTLAAGLLGGFDLARSQALAESIGQRIARLRKERGVTQIELAERLGVTQPLVSNWERGEIRLHGELIVELARIFGVSADELLGLSAPTATSSSPARRRLSRRLQAIDKLSKRDQEALLRTIDAFLGKAS